MSDQRDWRHDMNALQEIALEEIMPLWREDGPHPNQDRPTHEWLVDNGFANLRWILDEKHGMTVPFFFKMVVRAKSTDSKWPTDNAQTIYRVNEFLDWGSQYRQWRANTRDTAYYLLRRVLDEYKSQTDRDDLITIATDETNATETYDDFVEVFYHIKQDSKSDDSAYQYLRMSQRFYEWLNRRHLIHFNPIRDIEKEFQWDRNSDGAEPLTPKQVGQLWRTASDLEDYLIIIGYVIWGVRRKELTSIQESQFKFEDNLKIEFEETDRKTGAGTVEVLFGEQYIQEQLDRNKSKSQWNGHLIPDPDDISRPLEPRKAANRFETLCEDANVLIDDDPATPVNGRATWHDFQARAKAVLREIAEEYGDEQDYEDVDSMLGYQGDRTKEQMRQDLFVQKFKSVLPDDAYKDDLIFLRDLRNLYELDDFS